MDGPFNRFLSELVFYSFSNIERIVSVDRNNDIPQQEYLMYLIGRGLMKFRFLETAAKLANKR